MAEDKLFGEWKTGCFAVEQKKDVTGTLLCYDVAKFDRDKPDADISMVTDYDVRYLKIISKIFSKGLPVDSWKGKSHKDLLEHLENGGEIAAYWHGGVIAGAVVWQWDAKKSEGKILQICFTKRLRGFGYGRLLLDYILFKIKNSADYLNDEGLLYAEKPPQDEAARFFESYGFAEVFGDGLAAANVI